MKSLLGLVLLLATSGPTLAADRYVDAVNGSNSHSGTSAADAWLTITYAVQQLGPGGHTIHILPGLYNTALGESFPVPVANGMRFVGDAGAAQTRIIAGTAFHVDATHGDIYAWFTGITISGGTGIRCTKTNWPSSCISVTVRDSVFLNVGTGVQYYIQVPSFPFSCNSIVMDNVQVLGGGNGIYIEHLEVDDIAVTLTDCLFKGQSQPSVTISAGTECVDSLLVDRCRFEDSPRAIATGATSSGRVTTVVHDTLVAECSNGISAWSAIGGASITGSTLTGITSEAASGYWTISNCIFFDNGTDLGSGNFSVESTNLGNGGPPVGQNGNISVDPLFRDPEHGDYRLGWGTGCVDAIPGLVTTDLTGRPRGNDGDLDLAGAGDMGAFELRTLDMPETLAIGTKLHVDYHAETGQFATLFLARRAQLPTPIATPFGEQWLQPGFLENLGMQKVLTPHPVRRTIYIPNSPALVGRAFSFQALSRSTNAPQGAAWTDAATVIFTL